MIQLKRFEFNVETLTRTKILEFVNCPLSLVLPNTQGETAKFVYVLYAAVVHSGKNGIAGHYFTVGRHVTDAVQDYQESTQNGEVEQKRSKSKWFNFNDSSVTFCGYSKLRESSQQWKTVGAVPYMLFYYRLPLGVEREKEDDNANENETE